MHDSINTTDTGFIFRILHLSRVAVKKFLDEENTEDKAGHGFSWCVISELTKEATQNHSQASVRCLSVPACP